MTKKSLFVLSACALAGVAAAIRRRADDAQTRVSRELGNCEKILRGLDAQCANFR